MTIPDEAIQAAAKAHTPQFNNMDPTIQKYALEQMKAALTAAAPFLQGVKVKRIEWVNAKVSEKWERYTASTIFGTYEALEWSDGTFGGSVPSQDGNEDNSEFKSDNLEDAKAAAQADYEARVLSAIEPAPSPRAQALEDHHDLTTHYSSWRKAMHILEQSSATEEDRLYWKHELNAFDRAIPAAIRAISSHPVADGWLPIETAPKDGAQLLAYDKTNGYYNCWWHKNGYGEEYWMDEADTEPNPTHWRPLPASPAASE